jgi:hypothetical protein
MICVMVCCKGLACAMEEVMVDVTLNGQMLNGVMI